MVQALKNSKQIIVIFARWPEAGKVKSRLAQSIGAEQAARFYEVMLLDLLQRVGICDEFSRVILYVTPDEKLDDFQSFLIKENLATSFEMILQPNGTLAQKLNYIYELGFIKYQAQKMIFIGSDCPSVTPDIIGHAFSTLGNHDSVLGRASDGGYYLLGLGKFLEGFFDGINYSTESTAIETLEKLRTLELSIDVSLPELRDVDYLDDIIGQPVWVKKNLIEICNRLGYKFDFLDEID